MKRIGKIFSAILALCFVFGLTLGIAACTVKTDYTVTVTCSDEKVLKDVKVVLMLDGFDATEPQELVDGSATFTLQAATYTIRLEGVPSNYSYTSSRTVTPERPSATISLQRTSDAEGNPSIGGSDKTVEDYEDETVPTFAIDQDYVGIWVSEGSKTVYTIVITPKGRININNSYASNIEEFTQAHYSGYNFYWKSNWCAISNNITQNAGSAKVLTFSTGGENIIYCIKKS